MAIKCVRRLLLFWWQIRPAPSMKWMEIPGPPHGNISYPFPRKPAASHGHRRFRANTSHHRFVTISLITAIIWEIIISYQSYWRRQNHVKHITVLSLNLIVPPAISTSLKTSRLPRPPKNLTTNYFTTRDGHRDGKKEIHNKNKPGATPHYVMIVAYRPKLYGPANKITKHPWRQKKTQELYSTLYRDHLQGTRNT